MTVVLAERPEIESSAARPGEKPAIARDFGAAAGSYDAAARLQRHMGEALLERLPDQAFDNVVDLGCGTGLFLEALQRLTRPRRMTAADLSPAMLDFASRSRSVSANFVVADAEALPFADASQDLVFSNLMIQWCDHPLPVLRECFRVLRPGGWLLCSTLLDGTLAELERAWQAVDPGQRHINRFEPAAVVADALRTVFPGASPERRCWTLDYRHPADLLRELRDLGATHKAPGRRQTLTGATRLRRLYNHYPREAAGHVVATYEAAYLVARRPIEST